MAAGITIRPCRMEECPAVLDVWKEAEATPSSTDTLEEVQRLVREREDLLLVADAEGRIVGTIIAAWDGWRGNIYRLAILSTYRRRGIATALVREAERALSARGARRITALVERDHPWAAGFWDSVYERDPRMIRYVKTL